ncbi:TPA: hypothetical protein ACGOR9_000164 [Streptococcus suis]
MSDKTKLTWVNGSVIKQGDTSSVFKLKLRTDDNVVLNGPAKLQLIQGQAKIEYDAEVVDNQVTFNLPNTLPVGSYIVEVEHAGYVFPSTNSVVLTVNENLGDVITDEIAELLTVDDYIKQKLADFQTGQIDLDELASKLTIPQYDDGPLTTQISDILTEISVLKQSQEQSVQYDDSELKSRLTALENKTDNDTIYDDTIIDQRLTALESRPVGSSYDDTAIRNEIAVLKAKESYDDTEVKSRLTALEQGSGTGSVSVRRAPMSYTLDRTTNPWTVYFDNGCSMVIKNGSASELPYWYNYGQIPSATQILTENYIPFQVIRLSQGLISYQQWSTSTRNVHTYNNVEVSNPINDINQYNWSGYTNQSTGHVSLAKTLFALGIASESDILSLGATEI